MQKTGLDDQSTIFNMSSQFVRFTDGKKAHNQWKSRLLWEEAKVEKDSTPHQMYNV